MKKPNINPKVRNILEQMRSFGNIPRKKVKFQVCFKSFVVICAVNLKMSIFLDIFAKNFNVFYLGFAWELQETLL